MGEALRFTLKATLKEHYTDAVDAAWKETYHELSYDMIRAQVKK